MNDSSSTGTDDILEDLFPMICTSHDPFLSQTSAEIGPDGNSDSLSTISMPDSITTPTFTHENITDDNGNTIKKVHRIPLTQSQDREVKACEDSENHPKTRDSDAVKKCRKKQNDKKKEVMEKLPIAAKLNDELHRERELLVQELLGNDNAQDFESIELSHKLEALQMEFKQQNAGFKMLFEKEASAKKALMMAQRNN